MSQRSSRRRDGRTASHTGASYEGYSGPGTYPKDLVPFARPGDYVELIPIDEVRQVESMYPIPSIFAFDSDDDNEVEASANQVTPDQEATELEMAHRVLGQFRMIDPGADIPSSISRVELDQGGGQSPMWTTKNSRGFIDRGVADYVGMTPVTEIYVWEDTTPMFTFTNDGAQVDVEDLRFTGFAFKLTGEVTAPGGAHVEPVTVESLRTRRG